MSFEFFIVFLVVFIWARNLPELPCLHGEPEAEGGMLQNDDGEVTFAYRKCRRMPQHCSKLTRTGLFPDFLPRSTMKG
jgi:hypothetical protein